MLMVETGQRLGRRYLSKMVLEFAIIGKVTDTGHLLLKMAWGKSWGYSGSTRWLRQVRPSMNAPTEKFPFPPRSQRHQSQPPIA